MLTQKSRGGIESEPMKGKGDAMLKSTLAALLSSLVCVALFARQPPRSPAGQGAAAVNSTGELRQIVPGPFVYSFTTYNSGIIVMNEGLVVLDGLNCEATARAQRVAIASTFR